eukprot:TRINITY_DN9633_c0_g3_i5.p1 TRINITY_DN9633_c0_g3~~TRINITY_DN9633_c0_g3_i5.p1  ORF type:complete len:153 (+),score=40.59 TRINITY_DN9633_c0_g3_i5:74-532(+)
MCIRDRDNIVLLNELNKWKDENADLGNEISAENEDYGNKLTALEQKCEQLFAEVQRIRVENTGCKESERQYQRRKEANAENLRKLENKRNKYKHKKEMHLKEIKELTKRINELALDKQTILKAAKRKDIMSSRLKEYQQKVSYSVTIELARN